MSSADRINWLNVAFMIGTCGAAALAPFHLFLFAYAVLGPLHYLTEISWLHDRRYFAAHDRGRRGWLVLVALAIAAMTYGFVSSDLLHRPVSPAIEIGMFYIAFAGAAIALYVRHPVNAIAAVIVIGVGLALFYTNPVYGIAAYLLITIIHVFVFTGCFILYGATKSNSRSGMISAVVFVICGVVALVADLPSVAPTAEIRSMYGSFEQLNVLLRRFFGGSETSVMRFIAFAYTYHYLNWFSKTSVIGWHAVSRRRAVAIIATWLAAIAIYGYSFRAGFAVFYVLSALHVMLEFPLNHQSIAGLARELRVPRLRAIFASAR